MEKWAEIPRYSLYQASTMGRLKTFNWKNQGRERIMKPALDGCGYLRTMLKNDNGKIETIKVHRIILKTFLGEPIFDNYECNHKNGIRTDNRLINLEWISRSENQRHSYNFLGREKKFGEKNHEATLSDSQVIEIRKNYEYGKNCKKGKTKLQIAKEYNTSFSVIKRIIQGNTWRHLL